MSCRFGHYCADQIVAGYCHQQFAGNQIGRPGGAVAIGGGELACVGELVVTRRNDRTLTTTTRDIVRNRDRWIVTATHPDGQLTVSRDRGHGQIILPADYAREHVRLGYAATEHGNQGDTVDVAYQLISPATSRRGLYVAATRGRDRNQLLVIADTPDQAREVLEQVLLSDRADVPAVAQRRSLATALPNVVPPSVPIPVHVDGVDWLTPFRERLAQQQTQGRERVADYEQRRQAALAELAELTPLLDDARQAWSPYQAEIDRLNQQLPGLYPAQSHGLGAVRHARFGQRRKAQDALDHAQAAIRAVTDRIAAVETAGAHVKDRIGELQARARPLHEQSRPAIIERWDIDYIHDIDQLIKAIDTWSDWNTGRAVSRDAIIESIESIESIETLRTAARHAPIIAFDDTTITGNHYHQLIDPTRTWTHQRGINLPERHLEHGLYVDL